MNGWDRMPDEPLEWYDRFIDFCAMGPRRSLAGLWEAHRATNPDEQRKHVPGAWERARKTYAWDARAAAWDEAEIGQARDPGQHRWAAGRRRRLRLARSAAQHALLGLHAARLDELSADEARRLTPAMRQLLRDMLTVEREEDRAERATATEAEGSAPQFDADDYARAEAARQRAHAARRADDPLGLRTPLRAGESPLEVHLLAVAGSDPALEVDLARLRAVREETGFSFQYLAGATREELAAALQRGRDHNRPIRCVHMACHASPQGVELRDGIADGAWLSATLAGVEVLLIAGCRGTLVGDWLKVVPYVLTLSDVVSHADAAALTEHFWRGIGLGRTPTEALELAYTRCSSRVRETAVAHW